MSWILPGTVLRVDSDSPAAAEETLSAMFLTGGLVLSQVTQITGLEPYIVQNWVRRGFVTAPKLRKYTRRQLSRILIINALKGALPIEQHLPASDLRQRHAGRRRGRHHRRHAALQRLRRAGAHGRPRRLPDARRDRADDRAQPAGLPRAGARRSSLARAGGAAHHADRMALRAAAGGRPAHAARPAEIPEHPVRTTATLRAAGESPAVRRFLKKENFPDRRCRNAAARRKPVRASCCAAPGRPAERDKKHLPQGGCFSFLWTVSGLSARARRSPPRAASKTRCAGRYTG